MLSSADMKFNMLINIKKSEIVGILISISRTNTSEIDTTSECLK